MPYPSYRRALLGSLALWLAVVVCRAVWRAVAWIVG